MLQVSPGIKSAPPLNVPPVRAGAKSVQPLPLLPPEGPVLVVVWIFESTEKPLVPGHAEAPAGGVIEHDTDVGEVVFGDLVHDMLYPLTLLPLRSLQRLFNLVLAVLLLLDVHEDDFPI